MDLKKKLISIGFRRPYVEKKTRKMGIIEYKRRLSTHLEIYMCV